MGDFRSVLSSWSWLPPSLTQWDAPVDLPEAALSLAKYAAERLRLDAIDYSGLLSWPDPQLIGLQRFGSSWQEVYYSTFPECRRPLRVTRTIFLPPRVRDPGSLPPFGCAGDPTGGAGRPQEIADTIDIDVPDAIADLHSDPADQGIDDGDPILPDPGHDPAFEICPAEPTCLVDDADEPEAALDTSPEVKTETKEIATPADLSPEPDPPSDQPPELSPEPDVIAEQEVDTVPEEDPAVVGEPDPAPDTVPEPDPEPVDDQAPEPDTVAEPDTDAAPEPDAVAEPDADTATEPDPEPVDDQAPEPDAVAELDADAAPEPDAVAEPDADTATEPDPVVVAEPEMMPDPQPEPTPDLSTEGDAASSDPDAQPPPVVVPSGGYLSVIFSGLSFCDAGAAVFSDPDSWTGAVVIGHFTDQPEPAETGAVLCYQPDLLPYECKGGETVDLDSIDTISCIAFSAEEAECDLYSGEALAGWAKLTKEQVPPYLHMALQLFALTEAGDQCAYPFGTY
ncbi:MAG: hypothetical protein HYV03_07320, partial [Deltaproteobacteria bacterium]|nr:hypothetical protein [Deltaproteobacteria bacterium]